MPQNQENPHTILKKNRKSAQMSIKKQEHLQTKTANAQENLQNICKKTKIIYKKTTEKTIKSAKKSRTSIQNLQTNQKICKQTCKQNKKI